MKPRREFIETMEQNVVWARGMAITAAVAVGLFVLYPVALALRAIWRWA